MMIHIPGDQEKENPRMNMQALTIITGEKTQSRDQSVRDHGL
jgi:hypothetical protein